jgi:uncharacterized protein (TIGR00725 family)
VAYVAVVGPGDASPEEIQSAELIGRGIAQTGDVLVCGGLGGVMAAAARGAAGAGGTTVGLLPGTSREAANQWIKIAIPTGLGELRNGLVVRAADVVIAVGGAYGTLSEIALALKTNTPVIGLGTWEIEGIDVVESAEDALRAIHARTQTIHERTQTIHERTHTIPKHT